MVPILALLPAQPTMITAGRMESRPRHQKRLAPRQLLKRQLASGLVEILEAIEAVARVPHHLAGLAHVAKLPGELQQAQLGADDLLFLSHDRCPLERRGRALRTPTTPRPASVPPCLQLTRGSASLVKSA